MPKLLKGIISFTCSWTSRERSEDANTYGKTTGNGQPNEPDSHQSAGRC